ncbi:uncharacterized protein K460DRAFT_75983 [Cucurbitaria berberidis CBS 394.84]|uniref:Uncharacterized protein n=1 Tax=Cucurbitaria berberidis CBS 394.84 TaxID=1168544 RepID=A0A9P4LAY9_9PLEO|nr:uncharacterized protein K460DRAFT_75983 [Cucurbitaria berberidis CBS 394.84]KAF1848510.1 hypothetical protein K460DRAFT_75983 [Cucurbitaria berberidis CBS 394.84]
MPGMHRDLQCIHPWSPAPGKWPSPRGQASREGFFWKRPSLWRPSATRISAIINGCRNLLFPFLWTCIGSIERQQSFITRSEYHQRQAIADSVHTRGSAQSMARDNGLPLTTM